MRCQELRDVIYRRSLILLNYRLHREGLRVAGVLQSHRLDRRKLWVLGQRHRRRRSVHRVRPDSAEYFCQSMIRTLKQDKQSYIRTI
jgi:hypothetical protein